ncbi:MAG: hypothetical protein C0392_07340 [Syntrophus sp. (in: bacteria)]|nr:hypothetical protein [Syntrophus sp. (in: bacteria)]
MEQKYFKTSELYLASIISILLGIEPSFEVEKGRTIFIFPTSNDLYQAISVYNAGIEVNAYEFAEKIKRLRAEMIMRRAEKRN